MEAQGHSSRARDLIPKPTRRVGVGMHVRMKAPDSQSDAAICRHFTGDPKFQPKSIFEHSFTEKLTIF